MKNTLAIFFCFLSGSLFGQKNNTTNNYLGYYHAVAVSEETVVNGQYAEAVTNYKQVFEAYPYNNPIDCYVAAQVASYIRDTASCLRFLTKGICFGLPMQTIAYNPHLSKIITKINLQTIDSCWAVYQKNIDHAARLTIISLTKHDQSIIHNLPKGESIYNTNGFTLKETYLPVWDSLVGEVADLTRKHGFPAQKIIGTQNGEDSLFQIGPNSIFATYIFIHHSNAWSKVGKTLWEELLKGNITPQMYGVIYESSNGKAPYETPILYFASRPCQDKRCKKIINEHLHEINSNRYNIGLESYEVMQKKFESRAQYYKWLKKGTKTLEPFFDFECDLNFQGK